MEYILINEKRLKVMLGKDDLREWDMCAERLDYSNPDAKRIFKHILSKARQELGFDTTGHRVLLQLYPCRDGSCELFISCIGAHEEDGSTIIAENHTDTPTRAYAFDGVEELLGVCRILSGKSGIQSSSAWYDSNGGWFLTLHTDSETEELELLPLGPLSFISEYGEAISPRALSLYLCEYGNPICTGNAVEMLGAL